MEAEITQNITILTAFIAGVLSFLSPCVLPLIPGYISFISGASLKELTEAKSIKEARRKAIINSVFFILGFSAVFISLGAAATGIGRFFDAYFRQISIIAGIIIILAGVHMTGILRITRLYREARFRVDKKPAGIAGSFIVGFAFAFGWSPCIGPILGGILVVAGAQDTMFKGITLLAVYSLGLGLPFFLTAWSITLFFRMFNKIKKYMNIIEWTAGILLIIIGLLILTGGMDKFSMYLNSAFGLYGGK